MSRRWDARPEIAPHRPHNFGMISTIKRMDFSIRLTPRRNVGQGRGGGFDSGEGSEATRTEAHFCRPI